MSSGPERAVRDLAVGLLGGSFNPAHEGHLEISLAALHRLGLDRVWWLVSPQNPLKPESGMAPLDERMAGARRLARHPRLLVTDIEAGLGTRYTADTLDGLRRRHPGTAFVWLMGADNLVQMPHWDRWTAIFEAVPVAVFDRPTYSQKALSGKAARRYRDRRLPERKARLLARLEPPAWVFLHTRLNPLSGTGIREGRQGPDGQT